MTARNKRYLNVDFLKSFSIKQDYVLSNCERYKKRIYKVFHNESFILDFNLKRDAVKFIREKARD